MLHGGLWTKNGYDYSHKTEKSLIAVITVVKNGEKTLERTILSVINQTYKNIDFIVVDGASTDSTLDIIKKYEDKITYWISEPDNGLFYAMNKALNYVRTEWIHYLNSDDKYFSSNTLMSIVPYLQDRLEDIVYGNMLVKRMDGSLRALKPSFLPCRLALYFSCPIQQPAAFIRYDPLRNFGFDIDYKISADYKLWVSMLKSGIRVKYINKNITIFNTNGISSNLEKRNQEDIKIFKELKMPIGVIVHLFSFYTIIVTLLKKNHPALHNKLKYLFRR